MASLEETLANHISAEKRARQSIRRNAVNARTMAELRTFERKLRTSLDAKDKKVSEELLVAYMSKMDKAAQKGRVRTQTVSRKISRISRQIAAL
jgi:small subunit ribosomal protein S20